MADQRLPVVNSDDGAWGNLLVQYLTKEHYQDATTGVDFASNGSHKNVTIFPGTTTAAPLTFNNTFTNKAGTTTTAALLSTPASGAMEYDGSFFYLTQSGVRKRIAIYTDGTAGQQLTYTGSGSVGWRDTTYPVNMKTSGYTVTSSDTVVLANAASGAVAITLPAASSLPNYRFYIKRVDNSANACTVVRSGSDTIDGATSFTFDSQYASIIVVSDGSSAWYIL